MTGLRSPESKKRIRTSYRGVGFIDVDEGNSFGVLDLREQNVDTKPEHGKTEEFSQSQLGPSISALN